MATLKNRLACSYLSVVVFVLQYFFVQCITLLLCQHPRVATHASLARVPTSSHAGKTLATCANLLPYLWPVLYMYWTLTAHTDHMITLCWLHPFYLLCRTCFRLIIGTTLPRQVSTCTNIGYQAVYFPSTWIQQAYVCLHFCDSFVSRWYKAMCVFAVFICDTFTF